MRDPRRVATIVLVLVCIASLGLTLLGLSRYFGYERGIVEPLKEDLIRRTREAAGRIDAALAPARKAAEGMAKHLDESSDPTEEQLVELLREAILSDDACYGGTVAYEPNRFDPDRRLYAPYLARKNGEMTFLRIEESYDYTDPSQEWYWKALAEGPRWSEPYFDRRVDDNLLVGVP
jgi:hypothetical protein